MRLLVTPEYATDCEILFDSMSLLGMLKINKKHGSEVEKFFRAIFKNTNGHTHSDNFVSYFCLILCCPVKEVLKANNIA